MCFNSGFVGLIISFSLSGIFLNHRQSWNPKRYTYESKDISVAQVNKDSINDNFIKMFTSEQGIEDELRRFSVDGEKLKISYVNHDVTIDLSTRNGKIESYRTTPVLGQMTKLHLESKMAR